MKIVTGSGGTHTVFSVVSLLDNYPDQCSYSSTMSSDDLEVKLTIKKAGSKGLSDYSFYLGPAAACLHSAVFK